MKLAERGELPGRKVGGTWRLQNECMLGWRNVSASGSDELQKVQAVVDRWSDSTPELFGWSICYPPRPSRFRWLHARRELSFVACAN